MLYTILKVILLVIILATFIIKIIFMEKEIQDLKKKNIALERENHHLLQHNGKLFDANQQLKMSVKSENIPSLKKW